MIDAARITYRLVLIAEDGKSHDISDFVENLGWEENERELAQRISFTAWNANTAAGLLSSLVKPGCVVMVYADYGSGEQEAARGTVTEWKVSVSGNSDRLDITCYDELYYLQESQDNIYYSAGTGTRTAIINIFTDWQIPMETYEGPDVTHEKLVYKSKSLADILLDILDDAKKKGGGEALIRARGGKVSVLGWGRNQEVYHFEEDMAKTASYKMSTSGMVTRVKIIGQEDREGRAAVEATVNGLTQYGIRQKIYVRDKDKSLEDAQTAAQEILGEDGIIKEEMAVQAPDIPSMRKGDRVHLKMGALEGYYLVKGIRHEADGASMNLDLKKEKKDEIQGQEAVKKGFDVGQEVYFKGGMHYVSSEPGAKGYPAGSGKAQITKKNGSGGAHPYHLVYLNWSETHVYGWVDEGTFEQEASMAYQGNPGVSTLAKVMSNRIKTEIPSSLVLDFGSILADGSLQTNTFAVPIPQNDYVICRMGSGVSLQAEGGQHGGHESGDGSHRHEVSVPRIRPGDRVLVAWVQSEPVVVDVIVPATGL